MKNLDERIIRINKVLRELNISLERAIICLENNGIKIAANPNSKISENDFKILKLNFSNIPEEILILEKKYNVFLKKVENINELDDFNNRNSYFINENKQIEGLNLVNNKIFDLIHLLPFKDLKVLDLATNDIGDYVILKSFHNLESLTIADGTISNFNFLPLSIQNLSMTDCQIEDISFIEECINLKNIDFSYNLITNLLPLKKFKGFNVLNLSNNKIEDISPLSQISFFEMLNLENNLIFDLTPLYLSLKKNNIKFYNFKRNSDLEYPPYYKIIETNFSISEWFDNNLSIANNLILKNLITKNPVLNLGKLGLTDISLIPKLFECTHLETLILSNHYAEYNFKSNEWKKTEIKNAICANNISIIPRDIEKLVNLKILIVGGDWKNDNSWNRFRIKNISNIYLLTNLEVLNVSNNEIEKAEI